jgi:phosphopantothenoylcysteine decarboxylase/phosphopantothenate--cysteine ligase
MKVLITLGPTQEPIDEVRYITNASSGKMGAALARETIARGHKTTIVAGPVAIELPMNTKIIRVKTAKEMTDESLKELERGYDIFISTAAIADYSPEFCTGKMKSGTGDMTLRMRENLKLTALARMRFPKLFIVAFKAECLTGEALIAAASAKLAREGLDLIVANDVRKTAGKDEAEAYVIDKKKAYVFIPHQTKNNIVKDILDIILNEVKGGKKSTGLADDTRDSGPDNRLRDDTK